MTKASSTPPLPPFERQQKVIFLDIDGPMIPYRCLFLPDQPPVMELFDPVAVSLLNRACQDYGWQIVIHSSWVKIMGGEKTLEHCISQGLEPRFFHKDAYVDEHLAWRYTRVAKWLQDHPEITKYCILDDEPYEKDNQYHPDIPHPPGMADRLILINYYDGFLFRIFNRIREMDKEQDDTSPSY